MSNERIIKILKTHGVKFQLFDNMIIVFDYYRQNAAGEWIPAYTDIHGISKKDLYIWLGY